MMMKMRHSSALPVCEQQATNTSTFTQRRQLLLGVAQQHDALFTNTPLASSSITAHAHAHLERYCQGASNCCDVHDRCDDSVLVKHALHLSTWPHEEHGAAQGQHIVLFSSKQSYCHSCSACPQDTCERFNQLDMLAHLPMLTTEPMEYVIAKPVMLSIESITRDCAAPGARGRT